jgi:hypothetical protein
LNGIDDVVAPLEKANGEGLGHVGVCPDVALNEVETTEKERIIRANAYLVTITIKAPVRDCYVYTFALRAALQDDITLGGIAAYIGFKKTNYKDGAIYTLHITTEGFV